MRTSNKDLQVMLPSIGSIVLFHATWEGWPVVPGIVTQVESGDLDRHGDSPVRPEGPRRRTPPMAPEAAEPQDEE